MSTHNILFLNIKKKFILNYHNLATKGFVPRDEFETAVVNEPSVFEPPKFYCNCYFIFKLSMERLRALVMALLVSLPATMLKRIQLSASPARLM